VVSSDKPQITAKSRNKRVADGGTETYIEGQSAADFGGVDEEVDENVAKMGAYQMKPERRVRVSRYTKRDNLIADELEKKTPLVLEG
jgi:hypothetical protein